MSLAALYDFEFNIAPFFSDLNRAPSIIWPAFWVLYNANESNIFV